MRGRRHVPRNSSTVFPAHPVRYAFLATLGVGAGMAVLAALTTLSTVLVYIGVALFISVAIEPLVRWASKRSIPRAAATTLLALGLLGVLAAVASAVIPALAEQVPTLAHSFIDFAVTIPQQSWFIWATENLGVGFDFQGLLEGFTTFVANPEQIGALAGGILQVGTGLVDGVTGVLVVSILSLYFSLTLPRLKSKAYSLVARSRRDQAVDLTEEILDSVGRYVGGQVLLASINAAVTFLLTTILGSPAPLLLAAVAFAGALIPIVGPLIGSAVAVLATLSVGPVAALVAAGVLLVYLQVEAYLLTPKVMAKAVAVPGALVIIAALAGAALAGILGALVAVPVAAAVILIVNRVVIPRQQLT